MFGTLFKHSYKGKIALLVCLITSAACGAEISTFPEAAVSNSVTQPAFDALAQHLLRISRTAK